jgi:hypothetical protein
MDTLQTLGYRYENDEWRPPTTAATPLSSLAEADALHAALMRRADALAGCQEGSGEEAELKSIVDAIAAYEARRWPLGKDRLYREGRVRSVGACGARRRGMLKMLTGGRGIT